MANELAKSNTALPALAGASKELQGRLTEVRDNLESIEDFRLPRAKMTADGFEIAEGEEPVVELEGVILHTKKTNVYYKDSFNPKEVTPPTCFSLDGETPDKSVEKPVNPTCKGCPMAEFGTNSMKSGKACRNLKPIYMLLSDESIIPRQITVTPASLKVANQYLMDLTERGLSYRKVKTKVTAYKKDPRDTYMTLRFVKGDKLSAERVADVDYLRNHWLRTMNAQVIEQGEAETKAEVKDNGQF